MSGKKTDWRGEYPTTHWSQIHLASQQEQAAGQAALDRLLRQYQRPLLMHLQSAFKADEDQARDWFQEFVARKVLKNRLLARADQARGRFRTFLLNALDNFVIEQIRHAHRACRAPSGGMVSLDELTGAEPAGADAAAPDPGDYAWAVEVLAEAQRRTRAFYEAKGQARCWVAFEEGFARPRVEETRGPSKSALAQKLGFNSAKEVSGTITTVRRVFGKHIRAVVREYEDGRVAKVREEIRELRAILARGQ